MTVVFKIVCVLSCIDSGECSSTQIQVETLPSAFGERVVPQVDAEIKKKLEKAAAAKERGGRKVMS